MGGGNPAMPPHRFLGVPSPPPAAEGIFKGRWIIEITGSAGFFFARFSCHYIKNIR